ncbi:MAG: hypothetical protein K8F91_08250 [Candidatus Obscuribacterales bacterium]|nr:hypothetical protein [Candidatus Obscuribacterales bacterium]
MKLAIHLKRDDSLPFESSISNFQTGQPELMALNGALARMQDDVLPSEKSGLVARVEVKSGDTIRSIGRALYLSRQGRLPDDMELKEFELDTGNRNGLTTRQERNQISPGQELLVKLPALTLSRYESKKSSSQAARIVAPESPAVARQRPNEVAPPSCSGSWQDVDRIATWITHNEAGPKAFTAFNPNDKGNGISVGLMQWNQKRGKLPDLLDAWQEKDPAKFDSMFGRYSDDLLRTAFVQDADFNGNSTLKRGIKRALADPAFQQVQLSMRNQHIEDSCHMARQYRFTSLRGRAIVADLVNQIGEGGTRKILEKIPPSSNESQRIEHLKDITGGRINGEDRVAAIEVKVKEIWRQGNH